MARPFLGGAGGAGKPVQLLERSRNARNFSRVCSRSVSNLSRRSHWLICDQARATGSRTSWRIVRVRKCARNAASDDAFVDRAILRRVMSPEIRSPLCRNKSAPYASKSWLAALLGHLEMNPRSRGLGDLAPTQPRRAIGAALADRDSLRHVRRPPRGARNSAAPSPAASRNRGGLRLVVEPLGPALCMPIQIKSGPNETGMHES